ncbi:competence protein CoiA [Arthrobacter sp. TmT3-37]
MQLVALLDGNRLRADQYTPESWRDLQQSEDRRRLAMPGCGARAIAKARSNTQFFAHFRLAECGVEHGGESAQHLAMKVALAEHIDNVSGWHAVVEYPHPSREWIIDVLAESDDQRYRVAFEVQLSSQTMDDYLHRTQRYWDSRVFCVWLIPRHLEYSPFEVPVVVTGFGKSSEVPSNPSALMDLQIRQNFHPAEGTLGHFVNQLLMTGSHWSKGSPDQQRKAADAAARRAAAELKALTENLQRIEQRRADTNRLSTSPETRFGAHTVHTTTGPFVWATTTPCWKCDRPMLVWMTMAALFVPTWAI